MSRIANMHHIVIALMLSLAGVVSAQTLTARVKPEEPEAKKEFKSDPAMAAKVDALVVKLGDDSFKVRRKAKEELLALGKDVGPYLYEHLADDDVEVRENVKEVLAKIDPYPGLNPSRAEPQFFRKRALKNGAKPKTVGEKLWLDKYRKIDADELTSAEFDAVIAAHMAKTRAKKRAAEEKWKAKKVAKALAAQKAAEEKAKAVATKKAAEEVRKATADALDKGAAEIMPEPKEKKNAERK